MKRLGKIAVCLAGGLALTAGLRADELAVANNPLLDNPYATIAVRNIFGLVPPASAENPTNEAEKYLAKITPTGIMGVFGNWQVLFKVAGGAAVKPGLPPKDEFYILSEGQRQDDIEVIKIDEKKSLVTFNNHGTTQELPLANTPASGGAPAGAGPSPITGFPGLRGRPGGGGNSGGFTQFGAASGGSNGGVPNANPGSNGGGPNPFSSMNSDDPATDPHIYHPPVSTMSGEDVQAMIVINHLKAQAAGDPIAKLFPTTPHDQEAGVDSNSQQ